MFSKFFSINFTHVIFCPPLGILHIFFASFSACFAGAFLKVSEDGHTNLAFAFLLLYSMMSVSLFYADDR